MVRSWCCILFLLSAPFLVVSRRPQQDSRLALRVLYLKNCNDPENYAKLTSVAILLQKDGSHIVAANATVPKTVKSIRSVELQINRCRDAVSYNTCEYFTTWAFRTGLCSLLVSPTTPWYPVVRGIQPPLSCPIDKIHYSTVNASWDLNHPMLAFLEGFVWTGWLKAKDQDDVTFLCARGGLQALRVRGKAK